jgi:diguanylate cyclase (GGDEF)-like protein/PAS domain S-box-containing protein
MKDKPSFQPKKESRFAIFNKALSPKRSAFNLSLIYLIYGVVWILTTDQLLEFFFGTSHTYNLLQTFKGWIYVALTSLFVYWLIVSTLQLYQDARNKVQDAKDELEKQYTKTLESEQRFELAVKGSFDSIWEYDGMHDRYFMSHAILSALGYQENDITLNTLEDWIALIDKEDRQRFIDQVTAFSEVPTDIFEASYRVVRKDGSLAWIRTRGSSQVSPQGKILKVAGSHTDITYLIQHQEALTQIAYFDQLTGLPNWKGFDQSVTARIQNQPEAPFTLIDLDVDDFKNINDFHGYAIGDKLLVELANLLKKQMQAGELLSNLGGDGFGLLIESIDRTVIQNRIAQVYSALKRINVIDEPQIDVEVCLGITQYPHDNTDFDGLMHNADEAVNAAKHKGKNTYIFYTKDLHQSHLGNSAFTNKLRKAVEKDELSMMYQPIYRLSDDKMVSMEALVRWTQDGKQPISPDVFIPMAESTGLITNIELWVFEAVFKQTIAWRKTKTNHCPIAINLSSKGIINDDFINNVIVMMDEYGIMPGEIEIEITETSLIEQPENALNNLSRLRQQGMVILLDDFGKGYSSMTYLVSLPIDLIKLDKEFTQKIHSSSRIDAVISTIIELAHALDLKVIAEGIEYDNQKTYLTQLGADFGQGYLMKRPVGPSEIEALFRNEK